ncbi:uncharacterized protein VTP21DRAFT_5964 [Calcarisporiella thermophila]|uniref:uncharacterized protein n=1 Tax=Calcarisporiella thermophila TaxID=911321 RepID=UPI0037444428
MESKDDSRAYTAEQKEEEQEKHFDEKEETTHGDEKAPVEEFVEIYQFTWRSAIVGSLLGCVIAASNMYLGLKIGWLFGAQLWGAIFGFAIIKAMSSYLPTYLGGGPFGPKENCTAQSAATAAGGLAVGFVSAIPAMYKLGVLKDIHQDVGNLTLWTIAAAFYGLFFAVPLRKHFVVIQDLVFPTPRAAAMTIKSLHATATGEKTAMKKAYYMILWFGISFIWTLIAYWIPGIFESPRILYHIGRAAGSVNLMEMDSRWNWFFSWDFTFFGAGLMSPGATCFSYMVGQIIAYGIAGPLMWRDGSIISPSGFKPKPTAQSWFLWPGISLLVFSSFTELFIHYDVLWRATRLGIIDLANVFRRLARRAPIETGVDVDDPVLPHEQVKTLWWVGGTLASVVFTCVIMGVFYGMQVYLSLLAVLLAFFFSFVGLQASGETDINPIGPVSKVTQLVFAAFTTSFPTVAQAQLINLAAGNITSSAAAQSVDMVGDLKTGQLVGASPRSQFYAQIVGSIFAIPVAIGLFYLYATAYPCVTAPLNNDMKCPFGLVAVNVWARIAEVLTSSVDIPRESIITTVVLGVIAVIFTIVKAKFIPKQYHPYLPNLNAFAMGFIQFGPEVPMSMVIGWVTGYYWKRIDQTAWENYMYSVAAGSLGGVGISAVIKALFQIGNVQPATVGVGCLLDEHGEWSC